MQDPTLKIRVKYNERERCSIKSLLKILVYIKNLLTNACLNSDSRTFNIF